jgi:N4-gp56 family major capsid protein
MGLYLEAHQRVQVGKAITAGSMGKSFFRSFIGNGADAIIKTKLEETPPGKKGVYSLVPLITPLKGKGVEGNTDFAANRDKTTELSQAVRFTLFGNSLISENNTLDALAVTRFREHAKPLLEDWATDELDRRIITALSSDCTNIAACDASNGVKNANATSGIVAGDVLTTKTIDELVKRARNGFDGANNPHPRIKPVRVSIGKNNAGIEVYKRLWVLLVGGYQAAQLRSDPLWISAQEEAKNRGEDNPLFTGEIGQYNGVAVVDWDTWSDPSEIVGVVTSATTYTTESRNYSFANYAGASGLETEVGLFLGATAGLLPQDTGFNYYEAEADIERKTEVGIDRGLGIAKSHFVGETEREQQSIYHDKDFGTIAVVASKE